MKKFSIKKRLDKTAALWSRLFLPAAPAFGVVNTSSLGMFGLNSMPCRLFSLPAKKLAFSSSSTLKFVPLLAEY